MHILSGPMSSLPILKYTFLLVIRLNINERIFSGIPVDAKS
jgi:hypothetical protein